MKWIISANETVYDHEKAFDEMGFIDWHFPDGSFEIGDIVYIYISKPVQEIRFVTQITKLSISFENHKNDEKYFVNKKDYYLNRGENFIRLKLIQKIKDSRLNIYKLREHGIHGNIQNKVGVKGELLNYIEECIKNPPHRQNNNPQPNVVTGPSNIVAGHNYGSASNGIITIRVGDEIDYAGYGKIVIDNIYNIKIRSGRIITFIEFNYGNGYQSIELDFNSVKIPSENSLPEEEFVDKIEKVIQEKTANKYVYERSAKNKEMAIKLADSVCELDKSHTTFVTKENKNYTEVHHIIPLSKQSDFPNASLDVPANMICLCPNCHRMLHYGEDVALKLADIYTSRRERLEKSGIKITLEYLLNIYK